eukprot:PhM_4_TR15515/c0_g1_i1/m.9079
MISETPPSNPPSDTLRGWYVVLLFALLSVNECAIWFTFACVDPAVVAAWIPDMNEDAIRYTLLLGPIMYGVAFAPTTALATYKGGVRKLVYGAHVITVVASGLVCLSTLESVRTTPYAIVLAFTGLGLNALLAPTVMSLCPAIAAEWFAPERRGLPTSVAVMANAMGVVLWSPLGPIVATEGSDVPQLCYLRLIMAVVPMVVCLCYYPSNEPLVEFEDKTSVKDNDNDIKLPLGERVWLQLHQAVQLPQCDRTLFLSVCALVAVQCGALGAFSNSMQVTMASRFDADYLGWLAFSLTLAIIFGGIIAGHATEYALVVRHFHAAMLSLYALDGGCFVVLFLCFGTGSSDSVVWPDASRGVIVVTCMTIGILQGIMTTLSYVRPLLLFPSEGGDVEGRALPEAVVGLWASLSYNVGYAVFLGFPANLLADWCMVIEIAVLGLTLLCLVLFASGVGGSVSEKTIATLRGAVVDEFNDLNHPLNA